MRIAHITDLHLVERDYRRRSARARLRLEYLNTGRSIDTESRCQRVVQALRSARGSDHILVTGDLTEDGAPEQFEVLGIYTVIAGRIAHASFRQTDRTVAV